ncbi:MAG: VCBS domain-containing protein, partial [Pirellula sp.]
AQSDGKILIGGQARIGSTDDFALIRYNTDGSLDTTFGTGGKVTTTVGTGHDYGYSVKLQADGKIVVGGYATSSSADFALIRYNANGSLDTSFGNGGKVTTAIGVSTDQGYSIAIQPDGKVVFAGYATIGSTADFALVRYNADGTLDTTFGAGGLVTTAIGTGADYARSVAVQSDGKILIGGYARIGSTDDFALARYNADGSLDASFGTGGIITTAIGTGSDWGYSVTMQPDGKIVVAGVATFSNYDFALIRYNTDGSLDTTFDLAGTSTLGGTVNHTENGASTVLDSNVRIFDADLSSSNFNGATLALARNGGANIQDQFSSTGTLGVLTEGGNLSVGGTTIGTVTTNSGGTLVFTFNSSATNALVNSSMQQIAYANSSDAPPSSVQINWTFSDSNSGTQGSGGELTATGSVTVNITSANDAPLAFADAAASVEAGGLSNGTAGTNPTGNVLTNDTDPDAGDTKTIRGVAAGVVSLITTGAATNVTGTYGTINIATNGNYTYTLNNSNAAVQALRTSSDSLTDVFTYTMRDTAGVNSTTQITITITGTNDTPTATTDTAVALEAGGADNGTPGSSPTGNVLTNVTDVDSGAPKQGVGVAAGTPATPPGCGGRRGSGRA